MKINGTILSIGEPQCGQGKDGREWCRRQLKISHVVNLENGKLVDEVILVDYYGDTPQEELYQLACTHTQLTFTLWFNVRDIQMADGTVRSFQNISCKSITRYV